MTSIQHDNPDETIKPLNEDNDPPFSPPTAPAGDPTDQTFTRELEDNQLEISHPTTDAETDLHEQYDEGLSAAAEASEPNPGNAVADYDPDKDQRNDQPPSDQ